MILGVTGNIASGKSTVVQEFVRWGAVAVDADQLARQVVAPEHSALAMIVDTFGDEILNKDGSLDRERLAKIVFDDDAARMKLNKIVHPAIAELAIQQLNELRERKDIPLVVYEAPLLFEAGAESRVDKVLVVRIDAREQLRRLVKREGFSETEARKRIAAQMPQQEKLERADFIIDNSGTFSEMQRQVAALWKELVESFV